MVKSDLVWILPIADIHVDLEGSREMRFLPGGWDGEPCKLRDRMFAGAAGNHHLGVAHR